MPLDQSRRPTWKLINDVLIVSYRVEAAADVLLQNVEGNGDIPHQARIDFLVGALESLAQKLRCTGEELERRIPMSVD